MFPYSRKSAQNYEIILIFATAHIKTLGMNRLILTLFGFFATSFFLYAQTTLNDSPDNILGVYEVSHQGELTKVEISKDEAGTYTAKVIWVENRLDENGNVRLDEKNPDASLRHIECDQVVIIKSMTYDPQKQKWGDAKVYDPIRGIRANVQCEFTEDGRLRVRGYLLCFSQSIYWKRIE